MTVVVQLPLFQTEPSLTLEGKPQFPTTRYQGSKRKLVDWIWANLSALPFETVLDVFGGTGAVSYMFKAAGKTVTYNDYLKFNANIGLALIQNSQVVLTSEDLQAVLNITDKEADYPNFIGTNFDNIYYTAEENCWLDKIVYNIQHELKDPYKQSLARFALFQACLAKRPYNLFHRANLYMREAEVTRSFGNKTTWDTPFEKHFRHFAEEANRAVFDNGKTHQVLSEEALQTPTGADLVYLDPPYLNSKGVGVDYHEFYHFLEGLMNYEGWASEIDYQSRNHRLKARTNSWNKAETILEAFEALVERHKHSILVVSYRDDGIPGKKQLVKLLKQYKTNVYEVEQSQKYVLANKHSHELLLIAQ